jgi:hypothetical protein
MSTAGLSRGPLSPEPFASNTSSSSHHREVTRYPSGDAKSKSARKSEPANEVEFIDAILTQHARKLLTAGKIRDLGYFAANLDFHLATWFRKERENAAKVNDFVGSLEQLHADFNWPFPILSHPIAHYIPPKRSSSELQLLFSCFSFFTIFFSSF